jgi:hypothetical protein
VDLTEFCAEPWRSGAPLEERQRLDVADRAADLDDQQVEPSAQRWTRALISSVMWE